MNTLVIAKRENSENIITTKFPEPLKLTKIASKEFEMEVSWNNI